EADASNLGVVIGGVMLKQVRGGFALDTGFRASLGVAPDVPVEAINSAMAACRDAGVRVPEFPVIDEGKPVFRRPIEAESNGG
ncbi:MAG: hypothetical protein KDA83_21585, partial [Planctomycetales bacterium]|nr:hypothetical protein [Planctomycetales bacterium]